MSIRDFLARLSTQPLPPIASIAPIELENTFEAPTLDAPRNGKGVVPLDTTRDIIQFENGAPFDWDIESRSAAELGKGKEAVGARAYAEHPTTEILCVSYARSNGPIERGPRTADPGSGVGGRRRPELSLGRAQRGVRTGNARMQVDSAARLADGAGRPPRLHDGAGARARLSRQPRRRR